VAKTRDSEVTHSKIKKLMVKKYFPILLFSLIVEVKVSHLNARLLILFIVNESMFHNFPLNTELSNFSANKLKSLVTSYFVQSYT